MGGCRLLMEELLIARAVDWPPTEPPAGKRWNDPADHYYGYSDKADPNSSLFFFFFFFFSCFSFFSLCLIFGEDEDSDGLCQMISY